jgi:ferrous iron transport protein B
MDTRMVIALNMYDELERRGNQFDYNTLGTMIGSPIVPTISKTGWGIDALFDTVIRVYEENDPTIRHIHINYGEILENSIAKVKCLLKHKGDLERSLSRRYLAIKLLERDPQVEAFVSNLPIASIVIEEREKQIQLIENLLKEDCETAFTNARYGFVAGALCETFEENKINEVSKTQLIDVFLTHKLFGFPFFIFFMWLMFESTFTLGAYPMGWIRWFVESIAGFVQNTMSEGPFKDLLVDGIIGGVGGVIVFLPNILILYFFISFMEDSGYMARAAFIMDKIMHKMGLHGKSFISLVMGFGCNVPAVMATRTIESRNSRMITMLVNPLISCSARLPVYVLLAGAFFPTYASTVLMMLYAAGVVLAVIMARIFKRFLFKGEDIPFVMELPPYRMPTAKSILIHVWEKAKQYLQKMGGIILIASILIWFLGYFPRQPHATPIEQQQNSYIGQVGQAIQPVLAPLGFDWKISVSLLTGMAAKEVVVSTMSVLYTGEEGDTDALQNRLLNDKDADGNLIITPLIALSLLLFVLIYFPCLATISAIIGESKSWKWGAFVMVYTTALAWFVSFTVYQLGSVILNLIN